MCAGRAPASVNGKPFLRRCGLAAADSGALLSESTGLSLQPVLLGIDPDLSGALVVLEVLAFEPWLPYLFEFPSP